MTLEKKVTELGRKRWKEFHVAKEMLTRCEEEAAGRASNKASDLGTRSRPSSFVRCENMPIFRATHLISGVNTGLRVSVNMPSPGVSLSYPRRLRRIRCYRHF